MNRYNYPKKESWTEICVRPTFDQEQLTTQVQTILGAVKNQGDKALFAYTQKYDGAALKSLLVTKAEIQKGIDGVEKPLRLAIQKAKQNIEKFHRSQKEPIKTIETTEGVECWRKSIAIEKVGL